ncbi:MAG: hypothetical protein GY754_29180, partial [bacterium]|nr:hypothetical protein [bacterium]
PTPIPNPYIGKLADKLSSDVEVKGKPAAVKGSKSKATPGHIPMPPGVQFQKAPSNEGEVTLGTVPTVLVNGKEVAVLGSMVKTCGDPMDMETCSIIAAGAAVYLPIVIPGLEYAFDSKMGGTQFNPRDPVANPAQPGQSKTPSLSSPQWSKTEALVGEEMTLEVTCNDQYDNANVFFCIWVDGEEKKPNTHVKKLVGNNKGGKAKAKWRYVYIHDPENPVTEKPKFVFTAISFRCEEVESGAVEFSDKVDVEVKDNILGEEVADREYKLIVEGTDITREGKVGSDKKILEEDLPPGKYQVRFIEEYEEEESFGDGTDDVGELDSSKEE